MKVSSSHSSSQKLLSTAAWNIKKVSVVCEMMSTFNIQHTNLPLFVISLRSGYFCLLVETC